MEGTTETPEIGKLSPEQRKQALANAIASNVRDGWEVPYQSDYHAVLVKGSKPNHILHLILTLITLGLWVIVWIILAIVKRPRSRMISVDEFGNVYVPKPRKPTEEEIRQGQERADRVWEEREQWTLNKLDEGLSYEEIAADVGVSVDQMRAVGERALKRRAEAEPGDDAPA
jgi:hypothetical protein